MAGADGSVIIDTRMDTSGFQSGVANMKKGFSGLSSALGKIAKVMAGVFAVKQLVQFGKESIELGSDLAEVQNVVDVAFGEMSYKMEEFASTSIEKLGISELTAKRTGSTFMAMAKGMNFASDVASDMALSLTELSADMASFYNVSQSEAQTALSSVFTGETETLKRYGILITELNLQEYARRKGIQKSIDKMTQQEKVMLRYNYILDATRLAQGDFVRTQDNWANQTRILSEQFNSLKATIGQGLINAFTPILKFLNALLSRLQTVANAFKALTELITGNKASSGGKSVATSADEYSDAVSGAEDYANAQKNVADATKAVQKATNKYLSGLDEIRTFQKDLQNNDAIIELGDIADGGIGIGEVVDYGSLGEVEIPAKLQNFVDNFKNKFEEIFGRIKEGWNGAFKADPNQLLQNIGRIKTANENVWNAPEVQSAMQGYEIQSEKTLGAVAGSAASVATSFSVGITGGVADAKEDLTDFDKLELTSIYNNLTDLSETTEDLADATSTIATAFESEGFKKINEVISKITDVTVLKAFDTISGILSDIWELVVKPFIDNASEIERFLENIGIILGIMISPIESLFDNISDNSVAYKDSSVHSFFESIKQFSSDGLGKTLTNINDFLEKFINGLKSGEITDVDSWLKNLVGDWFVNQFSLAWENVKKVFSGAPDWFGNQFSLAWENVQNVFSGVGSFFEDCYNNISGAFSGIGDWFEDQFSLAWENVQNVFSGVGNFFSDVWSGIQDAFGNITNWFKDKFSSAWQAVKDVFSKGGKTFEGIKEGILSSLKSVINGLISGINNVITVPFNGINSAINKIKGIEIVGIKPFEWLNSIGVPQIPYLAKGAVIPPNAPFMAMLGDQKRGTNIEAPLSTIEQAVKNAMAQSNNMGFNGTIRVPIILNGRTIYEAVIDHAQIVRSQSGRNPFEMG